MDFVAQQAGGYENVGFIQKDMYNHFGTERRVQVVDGNAEGVLAYLCGKEEQDPMFYYKYGVDEENRLNNLFWTNGGSRTDYMYFGDVLVFDTTYRTNVYNKPFVMLQASETVETYIWVSEKFLDAMDHKIPLSVITDGDKAIRRAIKTVMLTARHRLCKWHLKMNALSNIHIEGFLHSFEKCKSMQCTQEMFELEWKNLVDKYSLHNNKWIADVYCKRTLWAEAYLHGHFFVSAKSTQRCESMTAFLNRFLKEMEQKEKAMLKGHVCILVLVILPLQRRRGVVLLRKISFQSQGNVVIAEVKCPKLENENIDSFPTQDTYVSGASMLHQEGGFNVDLTFTNSDYNIIGCGSNEHPTFAGIDYNIMGCDSNIYPNFVVRTCSETPDNIYGHVIGETIDLSK
ncbi:protein FAR1-RELATED SEQUENCE 5-like [Camellia sinensis]|uniref:protein FAR1-RELATED SEQUENCE 5-like n=1 Tax=Camellia sinensis TaxID=4442 RepID=UPI001036AC67|nr:protein FAR1-RELATED SEQUENCE 5-like [Camellia sinensis]